MIRLPRRAAILGGTAATLLLSTRRARAGQAIRLGILTDMSGPCSENAGQGSVVSAKLALADLTAERPDLKVELLTADAGTKTDTYVSLADAWYEREGVDAIFDIPVLGRRAGRAHGRRTAERRDATRAFAKRYAPEMRGFMPASTQAGMCSAPMHYLKTVLAMGVDAAKADGRATIAKIKSIPTDDPIFGKGRSGRTDARSTTCTCSR